MKERQSSSDSKERRLPQGVSKYIRRLKQEGKIEEALRAAKKYREEKGAIFKVEERLKVAVGNVVMAEDKLEIASEATMITWLLNKQGVISSEERRSFLEEIYQLNPDLELELVGVVPKIRDEASKLSLN